MRRPPDRRSPPILLTRSANEWINRINQKHRELATLLSSPEQKEDLDRWAETQFICSTLELDGINVSRDAVARIISAPSAAVSKSDDTSLDILNLLMSIRTIRSVVGADGRDAALTPDLLIILRYPSGVGEGFRKSAGNTGSALRPTPAEHLVATIESACRWFMAESFAELNPIEQASIVYLRLFEIQPFEQANERTALVAASLFTLRGELPLITITSKLDRAYRAALDEGAKMNTQPMVELIGGAVEQSLQEMIERQKAEGKRKK